MDDVERAVRERERPAVDDVERQAPGGRQPGVERHGGVEHLGPRVDGRHPQRPAATGLVGDEGEGDVGRARPHVEQRVRHGPLAEQAFQGPGRGARAAEPAIDPRQVAEVAAQDRRVVQRAVEELAGTGETSHRRSVADARGRNGEVPMP